MTRDSPAGQSPEARAADEGGVRRSDTQGWKVCRRTIAKLEKKMTPVIVPLFSRYLHNFGVNLRAGRERQAGADGPIKADSSDARPCYAGC